MPEPPFVIDASVLVRYLTSDNPDMQARAKRLIDSDQPLGLTAVAVLETAYVLHRVYGYSRPAVVDALVEVVTRRNLVGIGIDRIGTRSRPSSSSAGHQGPSASAMLFSPRPPPARASTAHTRSTTS